MRRPVPEPGPPAGPARPSDNDQSLPTDLDIAVAFGCLRVGTGRKLATYLTAEPDTVRAALKARLGPAVRLRRAPIRELYPRIADRFGYEFGFHAVNRLRLLRPAHSAHRRLTLRQMSVLAGMTSFLAIYAALAPWAALHTVAALAALSFLGLSVLRGLSIVAPGQVTPELEMRADDLPKFTILVALYREAGMVPRLIERLAALDYPADRLEILFAVEADDHATLSALEAASLPDHVAVVPVPASAPRTKPKALDFALPLARGEFVAVFDAEDAPAPDQLRLALASFEAGGPDLACVQASLNFYNAGENWLTRQFSLEYASFFELLLPALARHGLPIPLGGTSNYYRTSALKAAGGWDPFNVTEDADLGYRFAALGKRCTTFPSRTLEEATCRAHPWLHQRTRWLKGWLQTYFVRMRDPRGLMLALGPTAFFAWHAMMLGFLLAAFAHPWVAALVAWSVYSLAARESLSWAEGATLFHLAAFIAGYAATMLACAVGARRIGRRAGLWDLATMPVYWLLISFAAYRALWHFWRRPFEWEKTPHGLSRIAPLTQEALQASL